LTKVLDSSYAVLGDDVLIADKTLAQAYRVTLSKLGVDISKEKSYEGVDLQTFAGFTGLTSHKGVQVFRPFKHGVDFAIGGREVNVLSTLGPEVRKWSGWWSRSFDSLNRTYPLRNPDLSPILSSPQGNELRSGNPGSRWFSAVTEKCLSEQIFMGFSDPSGLIKKIPLDLGFLGETDWNRVWSTLLREKESVLHNNFDVDLYVAEERKKIRTNQITTDPLIMDQKLIDRVREFVPGTAMQGKEPTRSSKSLGR